MPHSTALVGTIAGSIALAFILGFLAMKLRLPPLIGYLAAGIVVGPSTPGFFADPEIAGQLAEIGVILLMFGVGVHFSLRDILAVRRIAIPGATVQIAFATALGTAVAHLWGWPLGHALVFGLSLSVASTVVLLRQLEGTGTLDSINGRIAVGWLVVEDLVTVLILVLLPALAVPLGADAMGLGAHAAGGNIVVALALTFAKVGAFVLLMMFVGRRAVPWMLAHVARTGSRELFTLSVLAVALGVAVGAAALFGVSFALGAFLAGVVISESDLSFQAAADALPLRDAFAVLFFVSVGMLCDPTIIVREPLAVLATVMIIMLGKSVAAFVIVLLFRYPVRAALTISASLAQIGEFSFILAGLGISLGMFTSEGQSLLLAGAIISIALNPFAFRLIEPAERWLYLHPRVLSALERTPAVPVEVAHVDDETLRDHAVIVGFGRVGGTIGRALEHHGTPYVVVEQNRESVDVLRARRVPVLFGDAARPGILEHSRLERARILVVASPGAYQTRYIIELARKLNANIEIVVRTHSEIEHRYLERKGVRMAVMGERELALGMTRHALRSLGAEPETTDRIIEAVRGATRAGAVAG